MIGPSQIWVTLLVLYTSSWRSASTSCLSVDLVWRSALQCPGPVPCRPVQPCARLRACRPPRKMPRRSCSEVRTDTRARQALARGSTDRVSELPGLSSRGRAAQARLEVTRLWPGQTEESLRYCREYRRNPNARRWDRPDSCGNWGCCPAMEEVRAVLRTVAYHLPSADARRLRSVLAAIGEDLS